MFAFERLAEEKIRNAIAAGEFDHLPGKGKPLRFDEPFGLRPEDRMAHTVLKNSGFLPEHLEWRKELENCLTELKHFHEHCRQRLGKILTRLTILSHERQGTQKPNSWLQRIIKLTGKREPNSILERGKEASADDLITRQIQMLRQTYRDERKQLRHRLSELANRADEAAQQVQQALVEKEIRDRRPLMFLLGNICVAGTEIFVRFDREFPEAPWENEYEQF
jgi:hypothetical protein